MQKTFERAPFSFLLFPFQLFKFFKHKNPIVRKKRDKETIASLREQIKCLEANQNRTSDYLENIIRVIPANIYWKDTNCVILGGNLSHAQQAGFSDPSEVRGKTDFDFIWKEHAEELIENDLKVMKSGVRMQLEENGVLADGALHTFLTTKEPLRDHENNIIGLIGVSTDITEFKKLQAELVRANELAAIAISDKAVAEAAAFASDTRAKAEEEMRKMVMVLVGDIVHDLRTPICTIKAVADLLEIMLPILLEIIDESRSLGGKKINLLNQNKWDYLLQNTPIHSIKNAIQLIDDFINVTLAELASAHKATITQLTRKDLIKCSIRRIIDKTLEAYPFTESERSKIQHNIAYDFYLMGNSILIMKMLFNLIKNALEQIALNGEGNITISTQKNNDYNAISIKDTGGGAPPEVVSRLFEDYFTTKKNGTGIGLAFCKITMVSFGGDIVCHSIYGESMEFILKFPKM